MLCVNEYPEFCQMAADLVDLHIVDLLNKQTLTANPSLELKTLEVNYDQHNRHHL